jgi:hypothetical protein
MARKGETPHSSASAPRAHKVAIRPVIQLPDVAHTDERLTVMLQRWAVAKWQTGDDTGLASRLFCKRFLAMQASVRAPQPLNAFGTVVTHYMYRQLKIKQFYVLPTQCICVDL